MEASREAFSQTLIDVHQGTGVPDDALAHGDTQMLELASGAGAVPTDLHMSRDEVLDRESRALATGDQMELDALGELFLAESDRKKQRRSSARGVMQVEIPPVVFDCKCESASRTVTFVGKNGKQKVFSYPELRAPVVTAAQFEEKVSVRCVVN